jgi:hypothetical protein
MCLGPARSALCTTSCIECHPSRLHPGVTNDVEAVAPTAAPPSQPGGAVAVAAKATADSDSEESNIGPRVQAAPGQSPAAPPRSSREGLCLPPCMPNQSSTLLDTDVYHDHVHPCAPH